MIKEIIKFGITGGLGTITNLLIFFVFVDLLKLPATPVSIFCFFISATQNYFINHLWTFKKITGQTSVSLRKWLTFISGALFGLAINLAVMNIIIKNYTLPYKFIAQGFGILAGMIVNFIISKFIVFRRKHDTQQDDQQTK
jgi:putative flippase GtrA